MEGMAEVWGARLPRSTAGRLVFGWCGESPARTSQDSEEQRVLNRAGAPSGRGPGGSEERRPRTQSPYLPRSRRRAWGGLAAVAMSICACGAPSTPRPTDLLGSVSQTTATGRSARVDFSYTYTPDHLGNRPLPSQHWQGVVDFSDHSVQIHEVAAPPTDATVQIITSGATFQSLHQAQEAEFPGRHWSVMPSLPALTTTPVGHAFELLLSSTKLTTDPAGVASALKPVVTRRVAVGRATLNDVATTEYRLYLNTEEAAAAMGGPLLGGSVSPDLSALVRGAGGPQHTAELWLDNQGRLRRLSITFPVSPFPGLPTDEMSTTTTVDLWDFGVPAHITSPSPSDVVSAFDLLNPNCQPGHTKTPSTEGLPCSFTSSGAGRSTSSSA